jgi:hypothetical protein
MTYDEFEKELSNRADNLRKVTEQTGINGERFLISVREHVANKVADEKQNLLVCSNLFVEIAKAAEDGIYPDGREGVINRFFDSQKKCNLACWIPMIRGVRRRAADIGIKIDAEVVYSGDFFDCQKGDKPSITHSPPKLGADRGGVVGAYAIFRDISTDAIIHREVMDKKQLDTVRGISKQPGGLMWSKFSDEGFRKAVVRRGIKYAANIDPRLVKIVERDDASFDISGRYEQASPAPVDKPRLTPPSTKTKLTPPSTKALADPDEKPSEMTAEERVGKACRLLDVCTSYARAEAILTAAHGAKEKQQISQAQYEFIGSAFSAAVARVIGDADEDARNTIILRAQDARDEERITVPQYLTISNAYAELMDIAA